MGQGDLPVDLPRRRCCRLLVVGVPLAAEGPVFLQPVVIAVNELQPPGFESSKVCFHVPRLSAIHLRLVEAPIGIDAPVRQ